MENLFEKLQSYFENTHKSRILEDWESTKSYDDVNSPLIEVFLSNMNQFRLSRYKPLDDLSNILFSKIENPDFSSDFFNLNINI